MRSECLISITFMLLNRKQISASELAENSMSQFVPS